MRALRVIRLRQSVFRPKDLLSERDVHESDQNDKEDSDGDPLSISSVCRIISLNSSDHSEMTRDLTTYVLIIFVIVLLARLTLMSASSNVSFAPCN